MMSKFNHLWNDLPKEERHRLMPYQIETQILHTIQSKNRAVRAHGKFLKETNDLIKNLERELLKYKEQETND